MELELSGKQRTICQVPGNGKKIALVLSHQGGKKFIGVSEGTNIKDFHNQEGISF
jgi:hypothetical protein